MGAKLAPKGESQSLKNYDHTVMHGAFSCHVFALGIDSLELHATL